MPRTNADAVKAICPLKKSTDDLTPFIETANAIVTGVCVSVDSPYVDAALELIERWLSAHFYCILRNQWKFRSAGKVQESVDAKVDLLLNQTRYGQQAMVVDYKGFLAGLNNSLKLVKKPLPGGAYTIGVLWLGKTPEEED